MTRQCIVETATQICANVIDDGGETYVPEASYSIAPDNTGEIGQTWSGAAWTGGTVDAGATASTVLVTQDEDNEALVLGNAGGTRVKYDSAGRILLGGLTASRLAGGNAEALLQAAATGGSGAVTAMRYSADAAGAYLQVGKSRGSDINVGSGGTILLDDVLGGLLWFGADGTDLVNTAALIEAKAAANWSATSTPAHLDLSTTPIGATAAVKRARVTSEGHVGINVLVPTARLHVNNDSADDSFLVEDVSGTDTTPFKILADGTVVTGHTAGLTALVSSRMQVHGTTEPLASATLAAYVVSATGPSLTFAKSRGASAGTVTDVAVNDSAGKIRWAVARSGVYQELAQIGALVTGGAAETGFLGGMAFSAADGNGTLNEVMRVVSYGATTYRVGIGNTTPLCTLDISGQIATRSQSITLVNGQNDDVFLSGSVARIGGPTAAFSVTGFSGGTNGMWAFIINASTQNMTIVNNSAASAVGSRLLTSTGADITSTGAGYFLMVFDPNSNAWRVSMIGA